MREQPEAYQIHVNVVFAYIYICVRSMYQFLPDANFITTQWYVYQWVTITSIPWQATNIAYRNWNPQHNLRREYTQNDKYMSQFNFLVFRKMWTSNTAHHIFYVCYNYNLCAISTRKKCANKYVVIKKYYMLSLVVHAGMKVASIAEKFMYIVR